MNTDGSQELLIEFSALAQCGGSSSCPARILIDGTDISDLPTFASNLAPAAMQSFATGLTGVLAAGDHDVTIQIYTANGTGIGLTNRLLVVTKLN